MTKTRSCNTDPYQNAELGDRLTWTMTTISLGGRKTPPILQVATWKPTERSPACNNVQTICRMPISFSASEGQSRPDILQMAAPQRWLISIIRQHPTYMPRSR
ncbi:hypothetical protein PV04_00677 [Phialophora macrospora]|uniref:Uncharacterized protein n=1 Tax=Phialophora macrospora TaxID=1851006 RepID=A0A0D2G182_9EURO|nr:hypothetical protein PV04_00677 [Phialophora macrospora]